jgi:hypothetical protein
MQRESSCITVVRCGRAKGKIHPVLETMVRSDRVCKQVKKLLVYHQTSGCGDQAAGVGVHMHSALRLQAEDALRGLQCGSLLLQ